MKRCILAFGSIAFGLLSTACSIDWGPSKEAPDAATPSDDGGPEPSLTDAGLDSGPTLDAASLDAAMGVDAAGPFADGGDAGELECGPGLRELDGSCVDQDECALALDDCDEAPRACVNTVPASGSPYLCNCPSGFTGDGRGAEGCQDVDECEDEPCGAGAPCSNVAGSFSCGECPPGHTGGGASPCVDVNECAVNNGGCGSPAFFRCENNVGAAPTCSDIDECSAATPYCDTSPVASCKNTQGASATCACPTLYVGTGVGPEGCEPLSCDNYAGCSPDYACVDTPPSVSCRGQFPDWAITTVPNRFTTSATTTTDAMTGLVWQRVVYANASACAGDAACASLASACGTDAACVAQEARSYCNNLVLDGQSDWRLPSRSELVSILDFTRFEPALDPVAFPDTPHAWFWTSSNVGGGALVFRVDAAYADSNLDEPTAAHRVRCVRQ